MPELSIFQLGLAITLYDFLAGYVLGFEIASKRQHMDQYEKTLIVPNTLHPVKEDGFVMSWMLHANAHGRIMLMVVRKTSDADAEGTCSVQVVASMTYNAEKSGEHQVDCSEKPLAARAGDLLCFMCVDRPMIPFDIEAGQDEYPLYQLLDDEPQTEQTIAVETWQQEGSRHYSLNAFIVPGRPGILIQL